MLYLKCKYLRKEIEENQRELDRLQMASNAFSAVLKKKLHEVRRGSNSDEQ